MRSSLGRVVRIRPLRKFILELADIRMLIELIGPAVPAGRPGPWLLK
jgi:hypothetical protein